MHGGGFSGRRYWFEPVEKGVDIEMEWEENVRKVTPYIPGEQPKQQDVIKAIYPDKCALEIC